MTSVKIAIIGLILIIAVNFYPGFVYQWYETVTYFDTTLHFLGGFFVAMLVFSFYKKEFKKNSLFFQTISLVGITMIVGISWEFLEYIASQTLSEPLYKYYDYRVYFIGTLGDTLNDLLMDMIGALSYFGLHFFWSRNTHKR